MGLVKDKTDKKKRSTSRLAVITAFCIGLSFILFGHFIFKIFDLTIPAFKIAGGILLFYVGFEMLQSKKSNIHTCNHEDSENDVSISPLAIPILAGPGTIVTAMNASSPASVPHTIIVIICLAIILGLNHLAFINSNRLTKLIGNNIIKVIGKIMGLVLSIMGVHMIIEGIKLGFNIQ